MIKYSNKNKNKNKEGGFRDGWSGKVKGNNKELGCYVHTSTL